MRNEKGQFVTGNNGKPFGAKAKIKTVVLKSIIRKLERENKKLLKENEILRNDLKELKNNQKQ